MSLAAAVIAFGLILAIPLPAEVAENGDQLLPPEARRLLAVTVAMAILWFTEAIPVSATALIPAAAYPFLGIASAKSVSSAYVNHLTFLFLGGMIIAVAIEHWNVHRRIALRVMGLVGTSPRGVMIGLLAVSAGLSMWISNTATTMLLLPIGLALLDELDDLLAPDDGRGREHLAVALLLAIAYGANCGGLATPVGTPTNAALLGFWDDSDMLPGSSPSLGEWVVVALPFSFLMLAITGVMLGIQLPRGAGGGSPSMLKDRLKALGPPTTGAKRVFAVFVITACLWVTRSRIVAGDVTLWPGWQPTLEAKLLDWLGVDISKMVHDATIAVVASLALFLITGRDSEGTSRPLLDWSTVERRIPWGVLLLFGSGFAIAQSFQSTGLAGWTGVLAEQSFSGVAPVFVIAGAVTLVTFLTEFTTNVATISTLLPVLAASAVQLDIDPVHVVVPATMAASCAFMLPIATPPNAVIYGSGRVPIQRMIRSGVLLNIASIVMLTVLATTLLPSIMSTG